MVAGVVMVLPEWCRVGSRHECNRCSGAPLPRAPCRRLLRLDTVVITAWRGAPKRSLAVTREGGVQQFRIGVQADQIERRMAEKLSRNKTIRIWKSATQLRIVSETIVVTARNCSQTIAQSSYGLFSNNSPVQLRRRDCTRKQFLCCRWPGTEGVKRSLPVL